MAVKKVPAANSRLKAWVAAAREKGKTGQWASFKNWARTGKSRGLTEHTLNELSKKGFDYKEQENRRMRKPYSPKFTPEEVREVRRQLTDLVRLLYPRLGKDAVKRNADALLEKTGKIQRASFEQWIEENRSPKSLFDSGRMYLEALDPKQKKIGKKRGLEDSDVGYHDGNLVLSKNWMNTNYERTAVFHEAAHALIGNDERRVILAEFYYSLKRGVMTPDYLRRYPLAWKDAIAVREHALALYKLGKTRGWKVADARLRKEVFA
ncbi:MAG: hypothetical protein NUV67_05595 [archaeon]|nr:hypothetical protein [archaeon]